MKTCISKAAGVALLFALAVAPQLRAQQAPAVVVSLASPQKLVADFSYLATASGAGDFVGLGQLLAQQYLNLMDVNQPVGVIVSFRNEEPVATAFLPIKDFAGLTEILTQYVGKPQDVGDGVNKLALDQPVFMKHQGNFLHLAQTADLLKNVPANPAALLGGLNNTYDLALRINAQNIPVELRRMAISQMKAGFERQAAQNANGPNPELQEQLRGFVEQATAAIESADTVTLGWAIDAASKETYFDGAVTAVAGSELAQQLNSQQNSTTRFGGFQQEGSAATLALSNTISPRDKQRITTTIDTLEKQLAAEIDKSAKPSAPADKAALREIVKSLMQVARATIAQGKMDAGGVMIMNEVAPMLQLAAGGLVADAAELDRAVRRTFELSAKIPEFPAVVKVAAATHRGVTFHTLQFSAPDSDSRKVFGDTIEAAVGIGDSSAFFALGGDTVGTLKKVIDQSGQPHAVSPLLLRIALTPMVRFAKSLDNTPEMQVVLDALSKAAGRDHLTVQAQPIPNGIQYRLSVEDGILQAVGQGVKSAAGGGF